MRQVLESPAQLMHTTTRWSKDTPHLPIIKVSYPYSQPLLDYVREMIKLTALGLNKTEPTFRLSDEHTGCRIYEYRVKMPNIVVKYKYDITN